MGFILLLLGIITYMFGIFAINLFESYSNSTKPGLKYQEKFRDLPQAVISLFQLLTLDQWYSIEADVRLVVSPIVSVAFFVTWVWVGAFIFRNIFVGVMGRIKILIQFSIMFSSWETSSMYSVCSNPSNPCFCQCETSRILVKRWFVPMMNVVKGRNWK